MTIDCPNCPHRVIPTMDGHCPECAATICPPKEDLQRYLIEQLDREESARVEAHLEASP